MAYQALYRTYRPQTFSEVIGQEVVAKALKNAVANHKTAQAYLFSGPRGTGKTSVARILAKALNCPNVCEGDCCGECEICRPISEGSAPDIIEIDAASNNGVDQIREIRDKVKFLPASLKKKVYIIDEVHMLSTSAFNALLKTLEEPPAHVVFILATTEIQKVPATILSRCQRFDFKPLTVKEIKEGLTAVAAKEGISIAEEALWALSESAEGGMRDALSYLDQANAFASGEISVDDVNAVTGNLNYDMLITLAGAIAKRNVTDAIKETNELIASGKEAAKIVTSLIQYYRDLLLYKSLPAEALASDVYARYVYSRDAFKEQAKSITSDRIFYNIDVLSQAAQSIRETQNPNVYLEIALVKMANASEGDLDIIKKVNNLALKLDSLSTTGSISITPVASDEAVEAVDAKINHITSTLSKFNLPSLLDRVTALENAQLTSSSTKDYTTSIEPIETRLRAIEDRIDNLSEGTEGMNPTSGNASLKQLENDIALLKSRITSPNKEEINHLKEELEALKKGYTVISPLEEKLKALTGLVESLPEELKNELSGINSRLSRLENGEESISFSDEDQTDKEPLHLSSGLEKRIEALEDAQGPRPDLSSFSARIDMLEHEMQLASDSSRLGAISNDTSSLEKEIASLSAKVTSLAQKRAKEETDPKLLEAIDKIALLEKNVYHLMSGEASKKKTTLVKESAQKPQALFGDEMIDVARGTKEMPEKAAFTGLEQPSLKAEEAPVVVTPLEVKPKEKPVEKIAETPAPTPLPSKKAEETVTYRTKDEEIVIKPNSELTTRIEKRKSADEALFVEAKPTQDAPKVSSKAVHDTYEGALYDVRIIERILGDAAKPEFRNDRSRVEGIWRTRLLSATDYDGHYLGTVFSKSKIAAVGNHAIILAFPSATLCNQVMMPVFKKKAAPFLFGLFGDNYDYMALPTETWIEKRREYISQYNIGIKSPKLTPIANPALKAVPVEGSSTDEDAVKATKMFGDIVRFK